MQSVSAALLNSFIRG